MVGEIKLSDDQEHSYTGSMVTEGSTERGAMRGGAMRGEQ